MDVIFPSLHLLSHNQKYIDSRKPNLSIQNLENTNYENGMFDYITSLSVIEHGVDIEKYFKEMNRILKKDGLLLTSTDYWEDKTDTMNSCSYGLPDIIFNTDEIKDIINIAERNGFELIEPIDFTCKDKVVEIVSQWD